jgi:hypothetical protein
MTAESIAADAHPLQAILDSGPASEFLDALRRDPIALDRLVDHDRSRDVGSHVKWFLREADGFSLWLNEYRTETNRGRAATIHNHRYGFASTVVFGELEQRHFKVTMAGEELTSISVLARRRLLSGQSYCLSADEIHQVSNWQANTATLVLKAPSVKRASQVFDLKNFTVRYAPAMSAIQPFVNLRASLSA